ncbi:MAG TPA: hypothetical protein VEG39_05965 [Clostridia bacterium]|nr:hypothetical protein [Clostridia bacterium]
MENGRIKYITIDEYIKDFPPETQRKLEEIRALVKLAAPAAVEK